MLFQTSVLLQACNGMCRLCATGMLLTTHSVHTALGTRSNERHANALLECFCEQSTLMRSRDPDGYHRLEGSCDIVDVQTQARLLVGQTLQRTAGKS